MHRRFWVKNSVAVQRFAAPARLSILVRIARHHDQAPRDFHVRCVELLRYGLRRNDYLSSIGQITGDYVHGLDPLFVTTRFDI